jgi:predicted ABC-type ATPase
MPDKLPAEEFFYLDEDGNKQDRDLHGPILGAVDKIDKPIDERIMAPIRARHRAERVARQNAKMRSARWLRVKARANELLQKGQIGLYRGWNEQDHPRHPAGSPQGGEFAGTGGPSGSGQPAAGRPAAGAKPHGRLPDAFSRESPTDAQRSRDVVAIWRPTADAAAATTAKGRTPLTFYEIAGAGGATQFRNAILRAKDSNEFGASVTAYDAFAYENMRLFTTPDGLSGFALRGDEVVSVFKHDDSKAKRVANTSLTLAVQQGGTRLDAFDTQLPKLYSDSDFVAVARLPWDESEKPGGWDKALYAEFNNGEPDVVFMRYDPENAKLYAKGDGRYVQTYEQGIEAQGKPARPAQGEEWRNDPTSASSLLPADPDEGVTVDEIIDKVPNARAYVEQVRANLKVSIPTDAQVADGGHKDGKNWTPEKAADHDRVMADLMSPEKIAKARPKPGEQPVLHLFGGRGGSGKSWFMHPEKGTVDATNFLVLNNDDVKERLKGYLGWNARDVHEESSEVGSVMEQKALEMRLNVIIDGTMKSEAGTAQRIADFKAAGYRVEGHYMYASPAKAAERALERFVRGMEEDGKGRFVAPEYSLGSLTNEQTFDSQRENMDYWEVYTNMGKSPVLHSRKGG